MRGLALSESYYRDYGEPLLGNNFPHLINRLAIGLVGSGSECFGFDDEFSRDHNWGPSFCIWMSDEDFDEFGAEINLAYDTLPQTYQGMKRGQLAENEVRLRGAAKISAFYLNYTGLSAAPTEPAQWLAMPQSYLAECTNGKVFSDPLGSFSSWRKILLNYYPEDVRRHKIAARCMNVGQIGQYNYPRHLDRVDPISLNYLESRFSYEIVALSFLLVKRYCPYHKWMFQALKLLPGFGARIYQLLLTMHSSFEAKQKLLLMEQISKVITNEIKNQRICQSLDNETFLMDLAPDIQATITDPKLRSMFFRVDDAVLY